MKNNLVSKLRNTLYMGLAVGTLGSYLSACKETIIGPEPKLSQTATLENYVDVNYKATLENVSQATRKTMYNGNLINTKSISGSSYIETLRNMIKGSYSFILENPDAKPDTARVEIPNYKPEANLSGLQTNFDDYSQLELDLAPRISDKNPEDNPVQVVSARSLDGKTEVSLIGSKLTIKPNGNFGPYQVETTIGGLNGGLENIMIQGEVIRAPDQIAFWRVFENYDDIALINEDGTGLQRLTTNPGQDLEPTWSPDGKELLFTSHRTGGTAVWRMDSDGSNQRDITSNIVERARQADWCSNGKIVVAYRDRGDSEAGIGIIDPNGTSFTSIYSEPRTGRIPSWPKWSPNCFEIAFERYVNGNWEIYTMNSDGTNQRNIPNNLIVNDQQATWSPDGTKMVFISDRANPGGITNGLLDIDLYIMNNDGTNITRLTYDIGPEADPDWSNDGEKIIFAGGSTNNFHLYLINENGTNMVRLTNNGENRY